MPVNAANTDWGAQNTPSITTSTAILGKGADQMKMEDFFNLLMAQMTNQDIMNPQDNTQMVAQMAQFSSLQAMNTMMEATTAMSEYQQSAYATSYVGKYVTIADIGEDDKIVEISGMVSSVSFYDGKPMVMVNGKAYDLHKVMKVNAAPETSASDDAAKNAADSLQSATDSYLGKYVILTHVDENGEPHDIEGYVDSVKLKAGEAYVVIGEEEYPASAITDVKDTPAFQPDDISKAATYIGKYVTVYVPGDTPEKVSGYVKSVEFKSPYAYVVFEEDGGTYPVSWITDVSASHPMAVPGAPDAESEQSGPFDDNKTVDMTSEQFAQRRAAFDARG